MPIERLKRDKSPSFDQIPAEMFISVGRKCSLKIHKLFNSIWNKEKLPEDWKESIIVLYLSIRRVIKQIEIPRGIIFSPIFNLRDFRLPPRSR